MSTLPNHEFPIGASATDGLTPSDSDFWERAFLAVLPLAMEVQGWRMGDKPISQGNDRVELAAVWADHAVRTRRARGTQG